jgi:hypothetical protein
MIEAIKLIGSIVVLLTGGFVAYVRRLRAARPRLSP